MGEFNEIIKAIGEELDIKVTLLSDNWLTVLEKGQQTRYIQGYKFSLNDHGIGNILDDKGLFYDLMIYKKNPIIEHLVIFKETNSEVMIDYFHKHNNKLVVKGNIGTLGKEVFLVENEEDLLKVVDNLFKSQFSLSLCPYYEALHEYRVIVLNNEVMLVYGKNKPMVVGDGQSDLLTLAMKLNRDYYQLKENQTFVTNYIPELNEEVILNFQFNLSKGATFFRDIDNSLKDRLTVFATKVARDANILFGSIDIIETKDHELLLMEANSGVMMENIIKHDKDNYQLAYNIYKKAIMLMFEEL